ncbi:MAG: shikimate kinase [Candidatus Peregrinibacteria bacterium]|nr:shikimate kinase [Candidatus Peregrinibacteria bacterium]
MIIALTGLRGSGKTKIGEILAEKLGVKFYDLDQEIEKKIKSTIKDLVEKKGWESFRKIESEVLEKLIKKLETKKSAKEKLTILSLGGGAIIQEKNAKLINQNCFVIYLQDTPENCTKKITESNKKHSNKTRPALTSQKTLLSEMKELYKTRHKTYKENADIILKRSDDKEKDVKKLIKTISENFKKTM